MTTPEKIRQHRLRKKINQEEMAGYLGISQRAYSKIETGETQIKIERLEEIAKMLDVNIAELLPSHVYQHIENITHSQVGNGKFINQASTKEAELYDKIINRLSTEVDYLKGLVNTLSR